MSKRKQTPTEPATLYHCYAIGCGGETTNPKMLTLPYEMKNGLRNVGVVLICPNCVDRANARKRVSFYFDPETDAPAMPPADMKVSDD